MVIFNTHLIVYISFEKQNHLNIYYNFMRIFMVNITV